MNKTNRTSGWAVPNEAYPVYAALELADHEHRPGEHHDALS